MRKILTICGACLSIMCSTQHTKTDMIVINDSLKHFKSYYSNGSIMSEKFLLNDKIDSVFKMYSSDNDTVTITEWDKGIQSFRYETYINGVLQKKPELPIEIYNEDTFSVNRKCTIYIKPVTTNNPKYNILIGEHDHKYFINKPIFAYTTDSISIIEFKNPNKGKHTINAVLRMLSDSIYSYSYFLEIPYYIK